MVETTLKLSNHPVDETISIDNRTSKERIRATHTQEIIFALCGYLGSNISNVSNTIKYILHNDYGYDCEIIKLSDLIKINTVKTPTRYKGTPEYVRLKELIENGNKLRETHGNEVLAELVIQKIGIERTSLAEKLVSDDGKETYVFKSRKKCYIIESIKNPAELEVLKEVYKDLLYTIGVFSPYRIRKNNLIQKRLTEIEITELIDQDSHEEKEHGQGVRKTFAKSDYFLRIDNSSITSLSLKLKRFIHLIFETAVITPTKDETAMYLASSASVNSACLSRQVGAAIVDSHGDLISVGWNDVPCFKGNLYQSSNDLDDINDNRCFNYNNGRCSNDNHKLSISSSLVHDLLSNNVIDVTKQDDALKIINKSRLGGLIEFSRAIHAEMHAIIIGSQKSGNKMIEGKLFCTTYPCHNCARHIVLAGITEVYYIEPYTKSLATFLHSDSLTDDENDINKVKILLYDGVSPNRYKQLFKMSEDSRKLKNGEINKPVLKDSSPKYTISLQALHTLESTAAKKLSNSELKFKD